MTSRPFMALVLAFAFAVAPIGAALANMAPPPAFKLGIAATSNAKGLEITSVAKDSPADAAGVKVGDVLIGGNARYVPSMSSEEMRDFVEGSHVWKADLIVVRGGRDILVIQIMP